MKIMSIKNKVLVSTEDRLKKYGDEVKLEGDTYKIVATIHFVEILIHFMFHILHFLKNVSGRIFLSDLPHFRHESSMSCLEVM